jgi:L-aminopeptidase/D-esterase-like protein
VHIAGFATGTRELDVLSPTHLAPVIDAILLTGGSVFGLAAADGVMRWLEEHGRGFPTQAGRVPLVPAAVIFDLTVAAAGRRPDASMGYEACQSASRGPVPEGAVGAGTGATVGKILGPQGAAAAGVGSWSSSVGRYTVGALAVVNALGDVLAQDGTIVAGARRPDGQFANASAVLREPGQLAGFDRPVANTTLAVVATDAPLGRLELQILARQSSSALARRIAPVFTLFDGDVVFALSTAPTVQDLDPALRTALAGAAQFALEVAIERAVTVSSGIVSRTPELR